MQVWNDYQNSHRERFLNELLELLRIPSVSARSEHKDDMIKCAGAVQQRLIEAGADKAEVYATDGHPVVYGEKIFDPSAPTVLVYGHYDVQPADPLELWKSGPLNLLSEMEKFLPAGHAMIRGSLYACKSPGNTG